MLNFLNSLKAINIPTVSIHIAITVGTSIHFILNVMSKLFMSFITHLLLLQPYYNALIQIL